MSFSRTPLRHLLLVFVFLCLGACGSLSADEHVARAKNYVSDNDHRAAIIELKNALQQDGENAEARLLLGEIHFLFGEYADALKEFERSQELGETKPAVELGIMRSRVQLGEAAKVIEDLADRAPRSDDLSLVLADAYLATGDVATAVDMYQKYQPSVVSSIGLGNVAWQNNDLEAASKHFETALDQQPLDREAWLRKGEVELQRGEHEAAERAFQKARDLPGGVITGRVGLIRVQLFREDVAAAKVQIDELLSLAPELPIAHYFNSLVAYQNQDLSTAENSLREVLARAPTFGPALYLMGSVKYQQKQLAQAEDSLSRFLVLQPDNASARKLLATTRSDQGDFGGALEALAPILATSEDPQVHALAGSMYMRNGQPTDAAISLQRAAELAPDNAAFRNQLALGLIASGDEGGARRELDSAIALDGEQFQSEYLKAMLS
ncbi:MAG: tetratricopeptide repeat protein [Proteobacteria bacterium]|nr:tetratricopeptide repeat protein [Pseudomonadota bacterium]